MKILVADKISPAGVEFMRRQEGFEVVEAYGSTPSRLCELARDVHAIIVRSESRISSEVLAASDSLKVIGRAGVGVDNIDLEAATQRGVIVMNTPDGNTIATAELTFTHLLCSVRPVAQAHASMSSGRWDRKSFTGAELYLKTLGVLGMGRIGGEVAKRARAFNMRVLAYDPYLTAERAQSLDVEQTDLETLLRESDFVTVHMPKTESTAGLIDARAMAKMKDGVRIINCARGGIVVEQDLLEALRSGKVAAAGLDVFESEPLAEDSPLRSHPSLVLTPHLGASTTEAQEGVGLQVAEAVIEVLRGGMVRNAINMPSIDPAVLRKLRPFLVLGELLGTVLQQLVHGSVSTLTITYSGQGLELETLPLTRAIQRGYLRQIKGRDVNDVNAPHHMKRLGIEVRVTRSEGESDYTELVRLDALTPQGRAYSIEGTLIGKVQKPRIVGINNRAVEASPEKFLLLLEHEDVLGIVGMVGRVMAEHLVNIANMSLSRTVLGGTVITALELDSAPSKDALDEIRCHSAVKEVLLVAI